VRYFACVVRLDGDLVAPPHAALDVPATIDAPAHAPARVTSPGFSAIFDTLPSGIGPSVARAGTAVGIGDVRLDNRAALLARLALPDTASDLEVAMAAVARDGAPGAAALIGDFAFVIWRPDTRELIAVRDALGVRTLFYRELDGLLAVSSHASALATPDAYDMEFVADYLVGAMGLVERTPFAGVAPVPAGSVLTVRNGSRHVSTYWSAVHFDVDERRTGDDQVEELRTLFAEAVRVRLADGRRTWSGLSGGLDSSSVVCMAHVLATTGATSNPIAGTLTFVDSLGDGDEREFVDAVVRHCGVRNEQLVDYWLWQDDGTPPPLTEAPNPLLPFYVRDRRYCQILRENRAEVLLTGIGGDQCFSSKPYFIADWIARGRLRAAAREVMRWSLYERTSFWENGFRFGVLPLLPVRLQGAMAPAEARATWLDPAFVKRYGLRRRVPASRARQPGRRRYDSLLALETNTGARFTHTTLYGGVVDVRHPFLHRPLIEHALRTAPSMRSRPAAPKWMLQEAMRGVLPELVRTRERKGGAQGRIAWSFTREHRHVNGLLDRPILADMGCISPIRLQACIEAIRTGDGVHMGLALRTLSLEMWLRVQSDRRTDQESMPTRALRLA
jgi:asparagine synthase (glutamine-hydrolysing)